MAYQFTPASQRALAAAAGWSAGDDSDVLEAPALLLGLLAEPECRAAAMLARAGIDRQAVLGRWKEMRASSSSAATSAHLSADVELSVQAAVDRLADYEQPLVLATEHLLLGLVAAEHEVSTWLREHGLDADRLEAEIHKIYGHRTEPLPLEEESPLSLGERVGVRADQQREAAPSQPPLSEGDGTAVLRVIDAAANRAREGLRVVEDYVRFVFDDRHLTARCKQMRHDLAAALGRISIEHRLAARETQADVGTGLTTPSESRREAPAAVLTSNLTRLQEALRTLEEFGKLLDAESAAVVKQLRYQSYTLQRAVEITRASLERLADARLYVLVDGRASVEEFEQLVGSLIAAGVHVLQLRDKGLGDRELLARARLLRELTARSSTLFIMNDRPDLAALSRADGVHVGQDELSAKDARSIVGPEALVGVSTHSIEQARQAVLDGANYLGVGPVFASGTKRFDEFPGLELLRQVGCEIRLPAFAIGGITTANLPEVLATGFTRVAVSGATATAEDPAAMVTRMLGAFDVR